MLRCLWVQSLGLREMKQRTGVVRDGARLLSRRGGVGAGRRGAFPWNCVGQAGLAGLAESGEVGSFPLGLKKKKAIGQRIRLRKLHICSALDSFIHSFISPYDGLQIHSAHITFPFKC